MSWNDNSTIEGNTGISSKTWRSVTSNFNGGKLVACASSSGSIWTNTTGSWDDNSTLPGNSEISGKEWYSVASNYSGSKIVACELEGSIWTSINGGTWVDNSKTGSTGIVGLYWVSVASNSSGTKLVAAAQLGGIWTSTNGGVWTNTGAPGLSWYRVASDYSGTNLVAIPQLGSIWTSTNSGVDWTMASNTDNQSWYAVAISGDGSTLVACSFGGSIWTSRNGGTWENNSITIGPPVINNQHWRFVASNDSGSLLVASSSSVGELKGSIWTSTNGGAWVDNSTIEGNTGIADKNWVSVATDSAGINLVAVALEGSIWTYPSAPIPTPTPTPSITPSITPTPTPTISLTPSITPTPTISLTPSTTQTPTPTPTPNLTDIICFKEGTTILTIDGYKPIQELRKGDLIKTLKHGYLPIYMIGKREIYHEASPERIKNQLYKCSKENYPEIFEDLIITGCHSILVSSFANKEERNKTIDVTGDTYVTDDQYRLPACVDSRASVYEVPGAYTIYHFALENDNYYFNYGVYANGLLVESCSKRMLKELSNMTIL